MNKLLAVLLLGLTSLAAPTAAQTRAVGDPQRTIHLPQFDLSGANCDGRHCEVTLLNTNGMTPYPAIRMPGDRLYVRVFNNTLADLTAPRSAAKGRCITYSTVRVELDNSRADGSVLFGAQLQSVLFNFAKLGRSAQSSYTAVLVFETELASEPEGRTSVLRLYPGDVAKYFRNAVEVRFTLPPATYRALLNQMPQTNAPRSEETAYHSGGVSLLTALGSFFHLFIAPVHAAAVAPPPTPVANPEPSTPAKSEMLSPGEIKVLLAPSCYEVDTAVPTRATYTISEAEPVAEMRPAGCGE